MDASSSPANPPATSPKPSPERDLPPASTSIATGQPLRVVSVSLGSSSRDHSANVELLGQPFLIERRGTDGDFERARRLIAELDGNVAAIGLGGIDLYLVAGKRRYTLRDGLKLARIARKSPVVDGSGLKDTLERETVKYLQREGILELVGAKVLVTCAVDRFGLSEELVRAGVKAQFGDFLFILGLPIRLDSLARVESLARVILPIASQLPVSVLYPTGDKQTKIQRSPRHEKLFDEAQIIAGDFHLIRRYLPPRIEGKVILTNTVTESDVELLRERGAKMLITSTPNLGGRSFGTNVMEGVFAALGASPGDGYRTLLGQLNWEPRVEKF